MTATEPKRVSIYTLSDAGPMNFLPPNISAQSMADVAA